MPKQILGNVDKNVDFGLRVINLDSICSFLSIGTYRQNGEDVILRERSFQSCGTVHGRYHQTIDQIMFDPNILWPDLMVAIATRSDHVLNEVGELLLDLNPVIYRIVSGRGCLLREEHNDVVKRKLGEHYLLPKYT